MSTTTTSRRRSSRLKSKQTKKEQEEEAEDEEQEELSVEAEAENDEAHESEQMSEEEEEEDYANRLRPRRGSGSNVDQDMSNLEGDPNAEYTDGDCVWAKYQDYPWWPGQIELTKAKTRRRKKTKRSTVTVRWFGDFPVKTNLCKLCNVIPWDPDDGDRIFVDVNEENVKTFQDSMDCANTVYLQICKEKGEDPLPSALDYEEKNASRVNKQWSDDEKDEATKNKKKKSKTKKKNVKKTGSATKSRRKKKVEKKEEVEVEEEEEEDDDVLTEAPALEPISDENLNERKRSLRSAKQSKPKKADTPPVNQRKSVRRRGRKPKVNDEKEKEKEDEEETKTTKVVKNKRGRKRKYDEAMNGDDKNEEEEEEEEEAEVDNDENDEDEDIDMEDEKESEKEKEIMSKKRRSNRVKAKKRMSDEEDAADENDDDVNDLYPESELGSRLNAAWNMCEATHSAADFTPWIALFYFGIRRFNNEGDKDKDVTNTVANIFHLEEDQVLNHLSEFTELAAKKSKNKNKTKSNRTNPRKKRKGN